MARDEDAAAFGVARGSGVRVAVEPVDTAATRCVLLSEYVLCRTVCAITSGFSRRGEYGHEVRIETVLFAEHVGSDALAREDPLQKHDRVEVPGVGGAVDAHESFENFAGTRRQGRLGVLSLRHNSTLPP